MIEEIILRGGPADGRRMAVRDGVSFIKVPELPKTRAPTVMAPVGKTMEFIVHIYRRIGDGLEFEHCPEGGR